MRNNIERRGNERKERERGEEENLINEIQRCPACVTRIYIIYILAKIFAFETKRHSASGKEKGRKSINLDDDRVELVHHP